MQFIETRGFHRHDEVYTTFLYLFQKFKKGIFVRIRNGCLDVFLPFSRVDYTNDWWQRVGKPEMKRWYTNNYLFRTDVNETDTNINEIRHLLEETCKAYYIPDIEFFINKRDFPLLKRNRTEPYDALHGLNVPLLSHAYPKYAPLFSMVHHSSFEDQTLVTPDDWIRACARQRVFFPSTKRGVQQITDYNNHRMFTPWEEREPRAVFRGSLTGPIPDNPRLSLFALGQQYPNYLDIDIIDSSVRPQIWNYNVYEFPATGSNGTYTTLSQQINRFQIIIHIQGHVQAFRLGHLLELPVVVLKVECATSLWYESELIPWVHYVPVASDLSNVIEQIEWCRTHVVECKQMIRKSTEFAETMLSWNGCLLHTARKLQAYSCIPLTSERIRISRELAPLYFNVLQPLRSFYPVIAQVLGIDGDHLLIQPVSLTLDEYCRRLRFYFPLYAKVCILIQIISEQLQLHGVFPDRIGLIEHEATVYKCLWAGKLVCIETTLTPVIQTLSRVRVERTRLIMHPLRDIERHWLNTVTNWVKWGLERGVITLGTEIEMAETNSAQPLAFISKSDHPLWIRYAYRRLYNPNVPIVYCPPIESIGMMPSPWSKLVMSWLYYQPQDEPYTLTENEKELLTSFIE